MNKQLEPRTPRTRSPRRAAVAAAIGLMAQSVFQLALAAGAPLGKAAYGGTHTDLSAGLRVTSAAACLFWMVAALVVLARAGYHVPMIGARLARIGTWVLVAMLSLGTLMNFASSGEWERFGWGPVTLVTAVLCFIVARDARETERGADSVRTGDEEADRLVSASR